MADLKKLGEEADARLVDCRRQKSMVELDIREAYYFTKPRLSRTIRSSGEPSLSVNNADELATGIGTEVNEDFATEIINAFMPAHFNWCRSEAGMGVPAALWEKVKPKAEADDTEVFKGVRASNFDAELATALIPDAGIGTIAMWIDDHQAHDPISAQHVPLRELEINVGPDGRVDDRFIVRYVRKRSLAAVLPGVAVPRKTEKKKAGAWVEVRWGFWRDWSRPADLVWRHVVQIDGEVVNTIDYQGEGSCPLIVGRFSPDSLHAFGNGPTIDSLPTLRVIDTIASATQDRVDIAVAPPFGYPDDGVTNFEGGLLAGHAYPMRPGAGTIQELYFKGDPDLGYYTLADLERAVKRKHFADYPEQPGKTPPTATQWLDEMIKSQRRIGTPGQKFWREFPSEVFLRYRYLLSQRGIIQPLQADGKMVAIRPYNPATKAQEQQEVQVATKVLDLAKGYFPMTSQAAIDEMATIKNIQEKLGDRIVVLRDEEEVKQLIQSMLQAASAGGAGGAGGPGGGAGGGGP